MKPLVELIYDTDCPNVPQARELLLRAFSEASFQPSWREFDRQATDSPLYAKQYGSPTILVNGKDVAGTKNGNGADCCRLYVHEQGFRGVPQLSQVVVALKQSTPIPAASRFGWRQFLATLPSLAALLVLLDELDTGQDGQPWADDCLPVIPKQKEPAAITDRAIKTEGFIISPK